MNLKQITPIMVVPELESCLPFWTGLGFQCVAEVAEGDRLGFAMLVKDGEQVMLQSEASAAADLQVKEHIQAGAVVQYLDVDSIEETGALLDRLGTRILLGPRLTSYGAKEIWVLAPGGCVVGFAEHDR